MPAETDTVAQARELRRCLDSTFGLLERVCERMPAGSHAFVLRAHLEGGAPETLHLIDQVVAALGGPGREDDESLAKSFRRGYQVAALMAREEETGERDPAAWKEDPDGFWEREMEVTRVAAAEPRTRTFRVQLAEKPADLLAYLVDHGPASPQAIAKALDVQVGLYSGGLNVLRELGLGERDPSGGNTWSATDDGRDLLREARDAG